MTQYERGAAFERELLKRLKEHKCVAHAMRSAGSHGAIDVAAWPSKKARGQVGVLFQCKTGGIVTAKDVKNLKELAYGVHAEVALAERRRGGEIVLRAFWANGHLDMHELTLTEYLHDFAWRVFDADCNVGVRPA